MKYWHSVEGLNPTRQLKLVRVTDNPPANGFDAFKFPGKIKRKDATNYEQSAYWPIQAKNIPHSSFRLQISLLLSVQESIAWQAVTILILSMRKTLIPSRWVIIISFAAERVKRIRFVTFAHFAGFSIQEDNWEPMSSHHVFFLWFIQPLCSWNVNNCSIQYFA